MRRRKESASPQPSVVGLADRSARPPHVLIIVQNLPVPFDRRVRLECQALLEAGYRVSVICPKGPDDPRFHVVEGIELYKHRPYPPTQRRIGFVAEYLWSFAMTAWLTLKVWRRRRFEVLQACNPPDIFWPLARLFHRLGGVRFVYDQHDLCPELYESRFPDGPALPYRALRFLEASTYRSADHVISTNGSYRAVALGRGAKRPDEVTVVRTGPDPEWLCRCTPDPELRRGHRHLACYLGVMGPQDGVDVVVRAAADVVHRMGRRDIGFILIGTGDCFDELVELARELDVAGYVEFTGRAPDAVVLTVLSTADVGLSPDPKNPLNDVSTMNKTMEYMALELPVVAFDLKETRVSAERAAVYAEPNSVERYAEALVALIDDEPRRRTMGATGRSRVEAELAWSHQAGAYVALYQRLLNREPADPDDEVVTPATSRSE
jgi:glycosyltransferase involved in cell wall biosynthesis